MRYKVKASSDAAYKDLLSLLRKRNVEVHLSLPRRRLLATGDLSADIRKEVASRGGKISEDHQYDLDDLARPA
jgi:hypothetical protein